MNICYFMLAAFILSLTMTPSSKTVQATPYGLTAASRFKSPQESAPSLEETLKWLQARLSSDAAFSEQKTSTSGSTTITFSLSDRVTLTGWEGCTLRFTSVHQRSAFPDILGSGVTRTVKKSTVRLADVKLAKFTPFNGQSGTEYYVVGLISDNKFLEESDDGTHASSIVVIPFTDKEVAERIAKAINHAMSICKDKKEPF